MISNIWAFFIVTGIIVGGITGNIESITSAAIESAGSAVEISLGLIGVMSLWLGLMKVAEEAGLVRVLAKIVEPFMKGLFPDIPKGHPAIGAIILNISANILGLGNAATPLGIKAMKELQKLNPKKDTATNAMCTFTAINTSSVTLIPATTIGLMVASGSKNPTAIIGTTIIATSVSTFVAIVATKVLEKMPKFWA